MKYRVNSDAEGDEGGGVATALHGRRVRQRGCRTIQL